MKAGAGGHRLPGYPEDISGLMEVSREFARNLLCLPRLLGCSRELTTAPLAYFGMYGTIIHPVILFTGGWCPTTHFGSAAYASG